MAHPEAEWPLQQNIFIFYFFLFQYFLVPLADTISAELSPESRQMRGFMFVQGDAHSENLYLIHNTASVNCAN